MTKYEKYKLIIMTIFCSIALFLLYSILENGRYVQNERGLVLDSKTGNLYLPDDRIIKKEK